MFLSFIYVVVCSNNHYFSLFNFNLLDKYTSLLFLLLLQVTLLQTCPYLLFGTHMHTVMLDEFLGISECAYLALAGTV